MTGSFGSRLLGVYAILAGGAVCMAGQQASPPQLPGQNSTVQPAAAQPAPTPAQTPGEIYKAAMHPLDVVRSSLDNWSDAELGALSVGIHMAHDACGAANPENYTGDDLYDLARLCALGQDWNGTNVAAQAYLTRKFEGHEAQVYALIISALVHMSATDLALGTTREMLRRLPYDAEVAYAVRYMKDELEQASNPEALKLAGEEHEAIVAAIAQKVALKSVHGDAVMSLGALYESAMELAFWQRYAGQDTAAAATVADLDRALQPDTTMTADDTTRIAAVRKRHELLGTRMPEVKALRALQSPTAKPQLTPGDGAVTVLVLFPDWCGGCRKMMKSLTQFAQVNKDTPVHAYGMVFEDDSVIPVQAAHDALLKELKGTATLLVPPATAQTFAAEDYPLGIVLDGAGRIRFIGALPGDAFNGGGYIEKTIVRVATPPAVLRISSDGAED